MIEIEITIPGCNPIRSRLELGTYTLGRALSSDVRLKHDSVQKLHAQLVVTPEQLSLSELAGGIIQKDGRRVDIYGPLRVGDAFVLGECGLRVVSSVLEESLPPRSPA